MNDLERLENIAGNSEILTGLDDSDLLVAGSTVRETARRWAAVDRAFEREVLDRAEQREATLLIGAGVDANIKTTPGAYEWNVPLLQQRLAPVVGMEKLAECIEVVPHICPATEYKVDTRKVMALVKKLGKTGEGLLEDTYTRAPGRPKVEYIDHGA